MRVAAVVILAAFVVACRRDPQVTGVDIEAEPGGTKLVSVRVDCNGATETKCEVAAWVTVERACPQGLTDTTELETRKTPSAITTQYRCPAPLTGGRTNLAMANARLLGPPAKAPDPDSSARWRRNDD